MAMAVDSDMAGYTWVLQNVKCPQLLLDVVGQAVLVALADNLGNAVEVRVRVVVCLVRYDGIERVLTDADGLRGTVGLKASVQSIA